MQARLWQPYDLERPAALDGPCQDGRARLGEVSVRSLYLVGWLRKPFTVGSLYLRGGKRPGTFLDAAEAAPSTIRWNGLHAVMALARWLSHNASIMSPMASRELLAFTADHVVRLTGLTKRQLGYWAATDFFEPTVVEIGRRPFARIYSFRDVVGLRTLAILRKKVPLQELRRVGAWLKRHSETPWSSLALGLHGRQVTFRDSETGINREAREGEQAVFSIVLEQVAQEMRAAADRLRLRAEDQVGKLERSRLVVHNKMHVAGTRIPTLAIFNFHRAGYTTPAIIEEFPRLQPGDVDAAIDFEQKQRTAA